MAQRRAIKKPVAKLYLEAKARQASKLTEIREALVATGCDTTAKQAAALGVSRPTAWVVLNRDKRTGPSAKIIKRILSSPKLPWSTRRKVEEYIEERINGLYGHGEVSRRWFRDQFDTPTQPTRKRGENHVGSKTDMPMHCEMSAFNPKRTCEPHSST